MKLYIPDKTPALGEKISEGIGLRSVIRPESLGLILLVGEKYSRGKIVRNRALSISRMVLSRASERVFLMGKLYRESSKRTLRRISRHSS